MQDRDLQEQDWTPRPKLKESKKWEKSKQKEISTDGRKKTEKGMNDKLKKNNDRQNKTHKRMSIRLKEQQND